MGRLSFSFYWGNLWLVDLSPEVLKVLIWLTLQKLEISWAIFLDNSFTIDTVLAPRVSVCYYENFSLLQVKLILEASFIILSTNSQQSQLKNIYCYSVSNSYANVGRTSPSFLFYGQDFCFSSLRLHRTFSFSVDN